MQARKYLTVLSLIFLFTGPSLSAAEDWERLTAESFDLYQLKQYDDAIEVSRKALAAAESAFGARHQVTGKSMNNLGAMLSSHGDPAEAERMLTGALDILEETLGKDDPGTSSTLNNLAELYSNQDRYGEAEPLFKRAIALREKDPGENQVNLINSLDNLAALYLKMDRFRDAEHLYEAAMEIKEEYCRKDHPDSEAIKDNLIQLYIREGNYYKEHANIDDAIKAYETALETMKVLKDPDLPSMAALLDIITVMQVKSGEYEEAVFNYQRLIKIYEELHGERSMEYAKATKDIARTYVRLEQYEKAVPLYASVADIESERAGSDYPELLRTLIEQASAMTSLANSYLKTGRVEDALPLFAAAIEIRDRTGKEDDLAQALRMNNLAGLLVGLERYEEAEWFYREALERSQDKDIANRTLILQNLSQLYSLTGEKEKAADVDSLLTEAAGGP